MKNPINTTKKFEYFDTEEVRGMIRNRMMVVTLDHDGLKIPIDKLVGRVTSFSEENDELYCEWEPYPTPNGKIGKRLAKKGKIKPIGIETSRDYRLLHVVIQKG